MPRSPAFGIRASAAALGVLRAQRRAVASAFPAGMVARWTMDDVGGLTDLIGGLVLTPSGTVSSAVGVIGEARSFAGTGYLSASYAAVMQTQGGFAVELWWKSASAGQTARLFVRDNNILDRDFAIYTQGALIVVVFDETRAYENRKEITVTEPAVGAWEHLAVAIHTDRTMRLYRNGVLVGSTTALPSFAGTTRQLEIMARNGTIAGSGSMDELAIYQFGASGDPGAAYWLDRYNGGAGRRP